MSYVPVSLIVHSGAVDLVAALFAHQDRRQSALSGMRTRVDSHWPSAASTATDQHVLGVRAHTLNLDRSHRAQCLACCAIAGRKIPAAICPSNPRKGSKGGVALRLGPQWAHRAVAKKRSDEDIRLRGLILWDVLAPRAGFEPATIRLTVECSTAELPRNRAKQCSRRAAYNKASEPCKGRNEPYGHDALRGRKSAVPPRSVVLLCNARVTVWQIPLRTRGATMPRIDR